MIPFADIIQRKAVNPNGRVGSLYNALTDQLLPDCHIRQCVAELIDVPSQWQIFRPQTARTIFNYFQQMKYQDPLLESMICNLTTSSSLTSFIDFFSPINPEMLLLYYSCPVAKQDLFSPINERNRSIEGSISNTNATHIITKVILGFEILCLISPSSNETIDVYQYLLDIFDRFHKTKERFRLTSQDEQIIRRINLIKIYSSEKLQLVTTSIITILNSIHQWRNNNKLHQPIEYELDSLYSLVKNQIFPKTVKSDYPTSFTILEKIRRISAWMKEIRHSVDILKQTDLNQSMAEQLEGLMSQYQKTLHAYDDFMKNCQQTLLHTRKSLTSFIQSIQSVLDRLDPSLQFGARDELFDGVQRLTLKVKMINQLKQQKITYIDVRDIFDQLPSSISLAQIDVNIQRYLLNKPRSCFLWYSTDELKNSNSQEWNQALLSVLQHLSQESDRFEAFYVDCTVVRPRILQSIIRKISSHGNNTKPNVPTQTTRFSTEQERSKSTVPLTSKTKSESSGRRSSVDDELDEDDKSSRSTKSAPSSGGRHDSSKRTLNVLLLGESGVGKSTFINAFVNYLIFENLEQAEKGQPVALIPVSFITTTGENFDEVTIEFGKQDKNEKHNVVGESVTQRCKSYVFPIDRNIDVRLIDTPGMCDTRGIDQDKKNMEHIIKYLQQYSHLDGICILLNPSKARLNIWLRSFLNQLFNFLTPDVGANIIFCFTNSRSSFYTPGSTGGVLRKFLSDERFQNIPFAKENIFCFDSESFRYLLCIRQGLTFEENLRKDYIESWNRSVKESTSLLKSIWKKNPYTPRQWLSEKRLEIDIKQLILPIAEILRLKIYNSCLHKVRIHDHQIKLNVTKISEKLCSFCGETQIQDFGPLKIHEYTSKKKSNAKHCSCNSIDKDFPIDSIFHHEYAQKTNDQNDEKTQQEIKVILEKFTVITSSSTRYANDRRLLTVILKYFLDQQNSICDESSVYTNVDLNVKRKLELIIQQHNESLKKYSVPGNPLSANEIEKQINEIKKILNIRTNHETYSFDEQPVTKDEEYVTIDWKLTVPFRNLFTK